MHFSSFSKIREPGLDGLMRGHIHRAEQQSKYLMTVRNPVKWKQAPLVQQSLFTYFNQSKNEKLSSPPAEQMSVILVTDENLLWF